MKQGLLLINNEKPKQYTFAVNKYRFKLRDRLSRAVGTWQGPQLRNICIKSIVYKSSYKTCLIPEFIFR